MWIRTLYFNPIQFVQGIAPSSTGFVGCGYNCGILMVYSWCSCDYNCGSSLVLLWVLWVFFSHSVDCSDHCYSSGWPLAGGWFFIWVLLYICMQWEEEELQMKIITIPMSYYFAVLLLSASGCLSGDIKGQKNNMIVTELRPLKEVIGGKTRVQFSGVADSNTCSQQHSCSLCRCLGYFYQMQLWLSWKILIVTIVLN